MNKLMGFYELRSMRIPTIQWTEFIGNEDFNNELLWTIRSAVFKGPDLSLPRAIGVNSKDAFEHAVKIKKELGDNGIVLYYPYFIANKSGTLMLSGNKITIEAVKNDLWNLVTESECDVTIIINDGVRTFIGDDKFLKETEIENLLQYCPELKRIFKEVFKDNKSILLEWSFANNTDINHDPIGDEYLVFYEVRSID